MENPQEPLYLLSVSTPGEYYMKGFLNFFGMSVGGWIGWALGAQVSIFTAFIVSMVGTGFGLFYTRRAVKRFLP